MSSGLPTGSSAMQPAHLVDTDPLVKYQTLLPILKESVNVSEFNLVQFLFSYIYIYPCHDRM